MIKIKGEQKNLHKQLLVSCIGLGNVGKYCKSDKFQITSHFVIQEHHCVALFNSITQHQKSSKSHQNSRHGIDEKFCAVARSAASQRGIFKNSGAVLRCPTGGSVNWLVLRCPLFNVPLQVRVGRSRDTNLASVNDTAGAAVPPCMGRDSDRSRLSEFVQRPPPCPPQILSDVDSDCRHCL